MYSSMSDIGHSSAQAKPYSSWQDPRTSMYGSSTSFSHGPPPLPESARPHNRVASDSSYASNSSRSTLDEQKMAYLKALAAREAYQQRRAGGEAAPLTALEEKERLRKLYAEEEERAANTSAESQYTERQQQHVASKPFAPSVGPLYSPGSVYLTPGTSAPRGPSTSVEYFDQPTIAAAVAGGGSSGDNSNNSNSSSSHGHNTYAGVGGVQASASEQSHVSSLGSASVVSPSWHRNSAIAKGKQRRYSSYIEDSTDHASTQSAPQRPPKPREVLRDEYGHLDTPLSPGAAEYERQFMFRHSISASSHSGH